MIISQTKARISVSAKHLQETDPYLLASHVDAKGMDAFHRQTETATFCRECFRQVLCSNAQQGD